MKDNPLVSVAMVTYNSARYISMAIESVLSSSYENLELIICDDNSSDDTWEIIMSYKDPRVRAVRNKVNIGEYPNRNQCIDMASGEYLIFIDGDDVLYPHGLEFMTKMLHAFPECGMALMRWFRNNIIYPVVISPRQFYLGEYFSDGFLGTAFSNVLFRTSVLIEQGKLDNSYRAGDDYIRFKIGAIYPTLLINDGLTWWRETPGQASQLLAQSKNSFSEAYKLKWFFLNHPGCPLTSMELDQAKYNVQLALTKRMLRMVLRGDFKRALNIYKEFALPFGTFFNVFNKPVTKDPLEEYTPVRPYMVAFGKNPYSSRKITSLYGEN